MKASFEVHGTETGCHRLILVEGELAVKGDECQRVYRDYFLYMAIDQV